MRIQLETVGRPSPDRRDEGRRSDMKAEIVGSAIGELEELQPAGGVSLNVDVFNNGPPSITKNWTLAVKLRNGEVFPGKETLTWISSYAQGNDSYPVMEMHPEDFIDRKTATIPVPKGGRVRGVIVFVFFGIPRERLIDLGTELILTFQDSRSRTATTRYVIPTKVDHLFRPQPRERPEEQKLREQREDVWNRLTAFASLGSSDDLIDSRFTIVNDGNSDIGKHTIVCRINSLQYHNNVLFQQSLASPKQFDRGALKHGGDGESVQCVGLPVAGLGPLECADITLVVNYVLAAEPQMLQEKDFRFATIRTRTGRSWDVQPTSSRIDYCAPSPSP